MFAWQFSSSGGKSKSWYITALMVALSLAIYGIVVGMYLMSIVVFLFAGVYILMENNSLPVSSVEINGNFIKVNDTIYEFNKIDRFTFLSHEGNYILLRLFVKSRIANIVDIPLTTEVDTSSLKEYLSTVIPYDDSADWTKTDRIIHTMGL